MNSIYQITNLLNGKIYIGAHTCPNKRCVRNGICTYFGSGKALKQAVTKYGKHWFDKQVLMTFDDVETMFIVEQFLVNDEFVKREDTYNLVVGGRAGKHGSSHSSDTKRRLRESHLGHIHSTETRMKISESVKMNHPLRGKTGNDHPSFGLRRSDETKQRMRESQLGKKLSDEHKQKLSEASKQWYARRKNHGDSL